MNPKNLAIAAGLAWAVPGAVCGMMFAGQASSHSNHPLLYLAPAMIVGTVYGAVFGPVTVGMFLDAIEENKT
jgi:hypothetical protein